MSLDVPVMQSEANARARQHTARVPTPQSGVAAPAVFCGEEKRLAYYTTLLHY